MQFPIRFRITLLFTFLVAVILGLVAASVYFFSYTSRINTVKTRLTNRAVTAGRLFSRPDIFSGDLIQRIDSATSLAFNNNVMEAYDFDNNKIYAYSSLPGDSLTVGIEVLEEARVNEEYYYTVGERDVVAYHYNHENSRIVIFAGGEDYEGRHNLEQLTRILLLSFSGGVAVAFLGGYVFSKGLLMPIKKIADEVNEISAQNFSSRINTGLVQDEWYYLSDTINALLERLQQSFELQRRFIANASHELSTPLTSISSQIDVSLQRERAAGEYRNVMTSVQQDVLRLSKLTQTLLQIAQASGTSGGLAITLVRIDDVLFRLPAEVKQVNNAFSVSIDLEDLPAEEDKLLVLGNEELLCSAIKNIAVNACKYSGDHLARLKLKVEGDTITIYVKDTGIGIPKDEIEHIFEPFYRVNNNDVKEGVGLGLSLASRIIKLHKGVIEITSIVGKGTTFSIMIPIANKK